MNNDEILALWDVTVDSRTVENIDKISFAQAVAQEAARQEREACASASGKPWSQKTALEKAQSLVIELEAASERRTRYSNDSVDGLLQEAADAIRALSAPCDLEQVYQDARTVFDAGGPETPQVVRDVIEWYAASLRELRSRSSATGEK